MDNTNNLNTDPSNRSLAYEDTGQPSNNISGSVMRDHENVGNDSRTSTQANANVINTDDNITIHQIAITDYSSTQTTVLEDLMDIDELMNSSSDEDDHHVASDSGNRQAQPAHFPCAPKHFLCDLCQAPLKRKLSLKIHKETVHGGDQKELCSICGARFGSRKSLTLHRKSQHPDKWATCELCNTEFQTAQGFHFHMRTAHEGNNLKLSCDVCYVKFKSMRGLSFHRKQQHRDELTIKGGFTKRYVMHKTDNTCPDCEFSSKNKKSVKRHYARVHSDGAQKSKYDKPQPKPAPKPDCWYEYSHGCGYRSRGYATMVCHERTCPKANRRCK